MSEYCPRCVVGRLQHQYTTVSFMYHGRVVAVPQVSVNVCDICSYQVFDEVVAAWLDRLAGDVTETEAAREPVARPQPVSRNRIKA